MIVNTERLRVQTVAARWRQQYYRPAFNLKPWIDMNSGDSALIYRALVGLDSKTATAADVAKIIGNDSWCGLVICDGCKNKSENTVQFAIDEYSKVDICPACIVAAYTRLKDLGL